MQFITGSGQSPDMMIISNFGVPAALRQLQTFYRGQELPKSYYLTTTHIETRLRRKQLFINCPTYCIFPSGSQGKAVLLYTKAKRKSIYTGLFSPHISNQSKNLVRSYQVGIQATSLYAIKLIATYLHQIKQKCTRSTGRLLEGNHIL